MLKALVELPRWTLCGLSTVGAILALSGCDDSAVLTDYNAVSPNRQTTIHVQTKDFGGPGTAAVITEAQLNLGSGRPIGILVLEHQQISTSGVTAVWAYPAKIDIYEYAAKVDFFKPKIGSVQIQLHDISRHQ